MILDLRISIWLSSLPLPCCVFSATTFKATTLTTSNLHLTHRYHSDTMRLISTLSIWLLAGLAVASDGNATNATCTNTLTESAKCCVAAAYHTETSYTDCGGCALATTTTGPDCDIVRAVPPSPSHLPSAQTNISKPGPLRPPHHPRKHNNHSNCLLRIPNLHPRRHLHRAFRLPDHRPGADEDRVDRLQGLRADDDDGGQ